MKKKRIAIIGAGPVGLEAGLYAAQLGFEIDIYEKGHVGHNISKWGHVSLFSPWQMNHSTIGAARLRSHLPEWHEPAGSALLTGRQFVQAYLLPLSKLPELARSIHEETEVVSVSRDGLLKGEFIGNAGRADYPFRLLLRDRSGVESVRHADLLIDASGVYGTPNNLGTGGIPAIGETASRPFIEYGIPDICGKGRTRFAGKTTLLVGAGYSAATAACAFVRLGSEAPETRLIWAVRGQNSEPIRPIENDSLESRAQLTAAANHAAANGYPGIECRRGAAIESIVYSQDRECFEVCLKENGALKKVVVHRVIANVGYGPDNSIYRELQVHECFASRGPMKLAAALLGETSADCLAQTSLGPDTLKNPEPNFYIIGNKSYGRNPTFLMRLGINQVVELFSLIMDDPELNLYDESTKVLETVA